MKRLARVRSRINTLLILKRRTTRKNGRLVQKILTFMFNSTLEIFQR